MADDRFAIRPGETFFDASTLPNQAQISYAIVLRGITHDVNTSILDGLGEDCDVNSNDPKSKHKLYPGSTSNGGIPSHAAPLFATYSLSPQC